MQRCDVGIGTRTHDDCNTDALDCSTIAKMDAFRTGRISTKDKPRPDRPPDAVHQEAVDVIAGHPSVGIDRRATIRCIAVTVAVKVRLILHALGNGKSHHTVVANTERFHLTA
jgi:hypothetical protein